MSRIIILLIALLFLATPAQAQTVLSVDITKARLSWSWVQGVGGAVAEFRVKCGGTTGAYTKTTVLNDPAARSLAILAAITGPGKWFCAVAAANQFGESALSNEVPFDAGNAPVAPTNAQIVVP